MKIYAISGLGADKRVFNYLSLTHEIIPINWVTHQEKDTIAAYAKRLIPQINYAEEFILMGVSFGGLIAIELAKLLQPKKVILISSVANTSQLPLSYRLAGKLGIVKLFPPKLLIPPKFLAAYLFGSKHKHLLNCILEDTNLKFAKWAVINLLNWKQTDSIPNLFQLCGEKDKLLPSSKEAIIIPEGEHFMIVDKASLVSQSIEKILVN